MQNNARVKVNKKIVVAELKESFASHRVPLIILAALLLVPKAALLWVLLVVAWTLAEPITKLIPGFSEWQEGSAWFSDLKESISEARPFILAAIHFFCIPVAVCNIFGHWLKRALPKILKVNKYVASDESLLLPQNKFDEDEIDRNFYHSPVFAPTILAIFVSGIPALISYWLYWHLGVDMYFLFPSKDPLFQQLMFTFLYIASVVCCLTTLFTTAWFCFPAEQVSSEHAFKVNEKGIKRTRKGWFNNVLSFNNPGTGANSIEWKDVARLSYGGGPFYPLPDNAFAEDTVIYRCLNIIAGFMDGIVDRMGRYEYITVDHKKCRAYMTISLRDLPDQSRKELIDATIRWAGDVLVDEALQMRVYGSVKHRQSTESELWFKKLVGTCAKLEGKTLEYGDTLFSGKITIETKLPGQGRIYSGEMIDGQRVILKEFDLLEEGACDRFEIEHRSFQGSCHKNVVSLLDAFVENQKAYLCFSRMEGTTLQSLFAGGRSMDEAGAARLVLQLCDVLDELQRQGQPITVPFSADNLLFRPDGQLLLTELPTSLEPQDVEVNRLGVLLDFLLTGGGTAKLNEPYKEIVERALDLDEKVRYESIAWLRMDLEQALVK